MHACRLVFSSLLAVLVALVCADAAQATSVLVCQKKNKAKLRVGECKDKEASVALDPNAAPVPSPTQTLNALQSVDGAGSGLDADTVRGLTPQQLVASGGGGLVVRDSNGTLVGPVLGATDGVPEVVRTIAGNPVLVSVTATGFFTGNSVSYEGSGCTGTPLIAFLVPNYLLPHAAFLGGLLYYPTGPVATHAVVSMKQSGVALADCSGTFTAPDICCTTDSPFPTPAAVASTIDVTTFGLTPPFHVE